MNHPRNCLRALLAVWVGLVVAVHAQEPASTPAPPTPEVRFSVLGPTGPRTASLSAFGGGELRFDLEVQAIPGVRFKVLADVFQFNGGIVAALSKDVQVAPEVVAGGQTPFLIHCVWPNVPAVQRVTRLWLHLHTGPVPSSSMDKPPIISVAVYPRRPPDDWKKTVAAQLSRAGLRRLAVLGDGTGLRPFLREHGVAFEDLGKEWPAEFDARTLYAGETTLPVPQRTGEAGGLRLILFSPPTLSSWLPGVYASLTPGGGTLWKVILPNLFNAPDDPLVQETLAEIFRQATEPVPTPPLTPAPTPTDNP